MLKERGMKKWQGFILPEQVEAMAWLADEMAKVDKPVVDEYQRIDFDSRVDFAMEFNLPVEFTVWTAGKFSKVSGHVKYVDMIAQQFRVKLADGTIERVNMADVVDVRVVED